MVILFLGDVVGRPGREAVTKVLPDLREKHRPDFIIANVENIVHGAGVKREKVEEVRAAGVDAFTTGDHVFDAKGAEELLDDPAYPIVRPGNWPTFAPAGATVGKPFPPGRGWRIVEQARRRLLLMNVLGRVFMKVDSDDPFACVERMLREASGEHYDASLLDLHAEATSEKRAIAEAFDGRISVIVGTHTHVQANDAKTLRKGTGFLSDAGMCGPTDSVIGLDTATIVRWLRTQVHLAAEVADGPCEVCGVLATVEGGRTTMELVRMEGVTV